MAEYELRRIAPDELDAFLLATIDAFHQEPHDEDLALWRREIELDRTLAAFADGDIVATSALLSYDMTVPGGVVPTAGVTAVGVHAVHRRRGLLDRMMRSHLEALHERGEPLCALWASEAPIYGRFGFGAATLQAELIVRSPEARVRVAGEWERPRQGAPAELLDDMRAVYERVVTDRPGLLARSDVAWESRISDFEHEREGAGRLRALVADGDGTAGGTATADDEPAGYALYAVRKDWPDDRPNDTIVLYELLAATPQGAAALWEHLLGLALTRSLRWQGAPLDEPLPQMLDDARAVTTRIGDGLYVRVVDVPRALAARTYSSPVDVVLQITDDVCPWNDGRWRVTGDAAGATCERADAAADLAFGATELGAVYLGGPTLATLAAAGRVHEHTAGAVAEASRAFRGVREPWCADQF